MGGGDGVLPEYNQLEDEDDDDEDDEDDEEEDDDDDDDDECRRDRRFDLLDLILDRFVLPRLELALEPPLWGLLFGFDSRLDELFFLFPVVGGNGLLEGTFSFSSTTKSDRFLLLGPSLAGSPFSFGLASGLRVEDESSVVVVATTTCLSILASRLPSSPVPLQAPRPIMPKGIT